MHTSETTQSRAGGTAETAGRGRLPGRGGGVIGGYAAAALLGAAVAAGGSMTLAQTRSQPGTRSEQPRQNPPDQPQTQPEDPDRVPRDENGDPQFRRDAGADESRGGQQQERAGNAYQRPFAFQSPEMETRFNESSRRLVRMERRMTETNDRLTQRLGEIRALSGERQNAALYDLLQEMLQAQSQMQEYLVQSRTAWTGELDVPEAGLGSGDESVGNQRPGRNANPRDREPREPAQR